ncbi:protein Peter pan [Schistocerca cancellata]|uniref:protein Peter pan n=1 Tax=Schistocerca cancellata TaxID=274614 RepID=UPI0021197934|nr:protein Peter pan [Schistocerca cancellata]
MGKKHKKGKSVKNNKVNKDEPEEFTRAPHSFIIHRGIVGNSILELVKDFRRVMEPFTATSLKARKKNVIKDFVSVAGLLHVSHMGIFTRTELSPYMKLARLPRGPTLTFRIENYTLARDVVSSLRRQLIFHRQFEHAPLVVLNNFAGEGRHLKLIASMFQNMFPTINLTKVNLNNIRRCVMLNYNSTSKLIDFRHYAIKVVPVGLSRSVKKLVQSKVPNLARYSDVSEFLTNPDQLSESEAEDDPSSHVTLPQKIASRGNITSGQSAIRLVEMGPRLTLQLIKIEEGLLTGEVLFHELVEKTEEEKQLIKKKREEKRKLKEKRKKIQMENKAAKEKKKEILKQKSLKGMQKGQLESDILMRKAVEEANEEQEMKNEDDDAQWYRQEVGQDPDEGLFTGNDKGVKRKRGTDFHRNKKARLEETPKFKHRKKKRHSKSR